MKAIIPMKPLPSFPPREPNFLVTWENGRLVIEIQAVIRVPIEFEALSSHVLDRMKLTARESQALDGILKGLQNKEIAFRMGISERTVKQHVSAVLEKFNAKSRGELQHILTASGNGHSVTVEEGTK